MIYSSEKQGTYHFLQFCRCLLHIAAHIIGELQNNLRPLAIQLTYELAHTGWRSGGLLL